MAIEQICGVFDIYFILIFSIVKFLFARVIVVLKSVIFWGGVVFWYFLILFY